MNTHMLCSGLNRGQLLARFVSSLSNHVFFPLTIDNFEANPSYHITSFISISLYISKRWKTVFKMWLQDHCCCSVTKSCLTLCDPVDCSTPGFPVLHYLLESPNSCPLSWWCHLTFSSSVSLFSSCPQSFSASGSFPMSWLFASDGQSIGASIPLPHVKKLAITS